MQDLSLSDKERSTLLNIARQSIGSYLKENKLPSFEITCPALLEKRGAFVTLQKDQQLSGCIGTFISEKPLFETVIEMAVAAATKDPRFLPLNIEGLNHVHIEISVLSTLKRIEDVVEIEVGRHGIFVVKGHYRGVLLPQVAVEHNWDRGTFLENACIKAGLHPDAWREGIEIHVFSAEIFGE